MNIFRIIAAILYVIDNQFYTAPKARYILHGTNTHENFLIASFVSYKSRKKLTCSDISV